MPQTAAASAESIFALSDEKFDALEKKKQKELIEQAELYIVNNLEPVPWRNARCLRDRSPQIKESRVWLELRRQVLCCSEVSTLMALNESMSRGKLMRIKRGEEEPKKPDEIGRRMMDYGSITEAVVLDHIRRWLPFPLITDLGRLRHKFIHRLEGTPDGVSVNENGDMIPFEVKCRSYPHPFDAVPYSTKFDVPLKYWVQLLLYMHLLGAPYGFLVNYTPLHGIKIFRISGHITAVYGEILGVIDEYFHGTLTERLPTGYKAKILLKMNEMVQERVLECNPDDVFLYMGSKCM